MHSISLITGYIMENPRARDAFNQAVVAVLCNWKALQIAVENEFGGNFTQEKASWLQQVTAEYFWSNGMWVIFTRISPLCSLEA